MNYEETSFEDLVTKLIAKDTQLIELLKKHVAIAIEKMNIAELLERSLGDAIEQALEDMEITEAIADPIKAKMAKILASKLTK